MTQNCCVNPSKRREKETKESTLEKCHRTHRKTVQDQQNAKKKKRKENIKAKADEKIEKNIERREKICKAWF